VRVDLGGSPIGSERLRGAEVKSQCIVWECQHGGLRGERQGASLGRVSEVAGVVVG